MATLEAGRAAGPVGVTSAVLLVNVPVMTVIFSCCWRSAVSPLCTQAPCSWRDRISAGAPELPGLRMASRITGAEWKHLPNEGKPTAGHVNFRQTADKRNVQGSAEFR
jgi:hypothetical protein